jgi:NTE family protein
LQAGLQFDIYAGNSAGALIAAILAQYPKGYEVSAAAALKPIDALRTEDVWQPWWPMGRVSGLWKLGLVDASPLRSLVHSQVSEAKLTRSGKLLRVGAISIHTGVAKIFTEKSPCIIPAVVASASVPGIFCPIEMEGGLWCDGGVRDVAPINAAIRAGATELIAVLLTPKTRSYPDPVTNAFSAILRASDVASSELLEDDLKGAQLYTELAVAGLTKKRAVNITVIRPDSELLADGQDSLTFDPRQASRMRQRGYQDAFVAVG